MKVYWMSSSKLSRIISLLLPSSNSKRKIFLAGVTVIIFITGLLMPISIVAWTIKSSGPALLPVRATDDRAADLVSGSWPYLFDLKVSPPKPPPSQASNTSLWSSFLVGVLGNIIGVLFGAMIGIPLGFATERRSANARKREQAKIVLQSISRELEKNALALKQALDKSNETAFPQIRMSAWMWAHSSGQLAVVPKFELQAQIADMYERLAFIKQLEDTLWSFSFSTAVAMEGFQNMLVILQQALQQEISETIKEIAQVLEAISLAQAQPAQFARLQKIWRK